MGFLSQKLFQKLFLKEGKRKSIYILFHNISLNKQWTHYKPKDLEFTKF